MRGPFQPSDHIVWVDLPPPFLGFQQTDPDGLWSAPFPAQPPEFQRFDLPPAVFTRTFQTVLENNIVFLYGGN